MDLLLNGKNDYSCFFRHCKKCSPPSKQLLILRGQLLKKIRQCESLKLVSTNEQGDQMLNYAEIHHN